MYATAQGAHTGVPSSVARDFIAHDHPGKLPRHVAAGGIVPRFDNGGAAYGAQPPNITPSSGTMNPMMQNEIQRYQGMPTEKLRELQTMLGGMGGAGQLTNRVLQSREMMPNVGQQQPQTMQFSLASGGIVPHYQGGGPATGGWSGVSVNPGNAAAGISAPNIQNVGPASTPQPLQYNPIAAPQFIMPQAPPPPPPPPPPPAAPPPDAASAPAPAPPPPPPAPTPTSTPQGQPLDPANFGIPIAAGTPAPPPAMYSQIVGPGNEVQDPALVNAQYAYDVAMGIPVDPNTGIASQVNLSARGGRLATGGPVPHFQGGGPMGVPMSMADPAWERNQRPIPGSGFLLGATPGRADLVKASPPAGSYVWPADVVAGLGEGNSLAGAHILQEALEKGPRGVPLPAVPRHGKGIPEPPPRYTGPLMGPPASSGGRTDGKSQPGEPTPIMAAHGEVITPPEIAQKWGHGDLKKGHDTFDKAVLHYRKQHIEQLKGLAPPKKK